MSQTIITRRKIPAPAATDEVEEIIGQARDANGVPPFSTSSSFPPSWLDESLISAGKSFICRHFFVIFFAHFISLILLLSYAPVRMILLKTNRSHTTELALRRYLSTLRRVKSWYEGDLTSPSGDGVRDILKVRRIHYGVAERLKGRLPKAPDFDENGNVVQTEESGHLITQLDMIVTQYCFMGLLTSYPEKFGINLNQDQNSQGLAGFIHLWALIGYHLGIEDRFNLCLGEKADLRRYVLNNILLQDLSRSSKTEVLWAALVSAISRFIPCVSVHASLLYILDHVLDLDSTELYWEASSYEKFCYYFTVFMFNWTFQVPVLRNFFNALLRLAIWSITVQLSILKLVVKLT